MLVSLEIASDKNPVSVAQINPPQLRIKPSFLQIAQNLLQSGYLGAIIVAAKIDLNTASDCKNAEPFIPAPTDLRNEPPGESQLALLVEILNENSELPGKLAPWSENFGIKSCYYGQTCMFARRSADETYASIVHEVKLPPFYQGNRLAFYYLYTNPIWNLPADHSGSYPRMVCDPLPYPVEIEGEDVHPGRDLRLLDDGLRVEHLTAAYLDTSDIQEG